MIVLFALSALASTSIRVVDDHGDVLPDIRVRAICSDSDHAVAIPTDNEGFANFGMYGSACWVLVKHNGFRDKAAQLVFTSHIVTIMLYPTDVARHVAHPDDVAGIEEPFGDLMPDHIRLALDGALDIEPATRTATLNEPVDTTGDYLGCHAVTREQADISAEK